ncbi:cora-domain-containing protein [Guyanagaster necrorhizus]|uniref:Cora-domain-containing protein n=1 Tax=Guyanagaster necrorhizus TaxID=856835 RepID=A0A9P8ATS3_9AGAR|nr:cora-domain-containing protein [Guyanagaster necrorhizus MCA 3950]KAG7447515.1 cora-domain-containing protein [Guyanagaster necrorhizus MCA 3950]
MSSPPNDIPVLSTSPASVQGGSPVRCRDNVSPSDDRPRHSPTLARSFDPNDPQVVERQRTMDVDMAMHLSRARRETIISSPVLSPYETPAPQDSSFQPISVLSPNEENEINIARGDAEADNAGEDAATTRRQPSFVDLRGHVHQSHDPSLLVSLDTNFEPHDDPPSSAFGLPTYQANVSHARFDFRMMEEFAETEKAALGISSPATKFVLPEPRIGNLPNEGPSEGSGPSVFTIPTPRTARQRKLSQSNSNPRMRKGIGKKLALFEGNAGTVPPSLPGRLGMPFGGIQLPSSTDDLPAQVPPGPGFGILNAGHDRPYRFSFYSNALSATIHARSLSELPADGQSFEDLFAGIATASPSNSRPNAQTDGRQSYAPRNGSHGYFPPAEKPSYDIGNKITGGMIPNGNFDGSTWWLDVQSPTDEEMKVLSKVFSIHPLTTEDIQMEEIREKIELFRNYYLVCFRSFDQDPYSPTHLEPLNMYIIVFREGTISFHFRPTPHPQNVRRRIKQLKDYISVTSDWISYALIDDITDAFGPLIQNIEYEVDSIDEIVLIIKEADQSDMLRRIGTCRKKVMGLLRLMGNKADVVKGLAKRCNENWQVAPTSDIGLYLSDIQDHLITMTQNLNHYEKILSRSHSNYLAQISIEMTDANNQINDVLSKLTALGTILIPMNLVTGLWGMNVHVPGQGVPGYSWFISIIACLATFALIGGYSTYKFMVR